MKNMVLVVMMALSIGVANAGEQPKAEVNPAPAQACGAKQELVTLPQPKESSAEVLACSPSPCVVCNSKIKNCQDNCNGDPDCIVNCDSECLYCCY